MINARILTKLFLSHSTLGLLTATAISFIFYTVLSEALIQRTLDQLSSINILKRDLVESYFFRSQQNLEALQVENKFTKIYHNLKEPPAITGEDHDLTDIENLCRLYNFKNIHVFDTHHKQLFSTDEEMYPEGLLTRIDSAVSIEPDRIRIIDASHHSPDHQPVLFYYVPILEGEELIGIVLVQENFRKIQTILLETTGMGNTGESYIVGYDFTLRSTSRFFPDSLPGLIGVDTEAARNTLKGGSGQGIIKDYRNVSVLSAYRNIQNADLNWGIISEIDEEEAMLPILRLRNYFIVVTLFIIALTFVITYFLSNAIVRPVLQLKEVILTLSKGMIAPLIQLKTSTDEIGEMAEAIRQLTNGLERTALFASEIGSGNFNTPFSPLSENDRLGLALLRMRDELRGFHENELKTARARAAALLEGQENERRRIIKELHDGVGQMLTAIRMQVDSLESEKERKEEIKSYINEAIAEVKRISYHVMPQAIVDFGLDAALKGLCDTIRKFSSLTIDFRYIREFDHKLDFEISIAVFRIAQEGLNNIVKHANATNVDLHVLDKEDELYFILEDNGKGFDEKDPGNNTGSGLRNIRERVMLLNGTVEIHTTPGSGTTLEIHIPIL